MTKTTNRIFLLGFILTTLSIYSCTKRACMSVDPKPDCICTTIYDPVCGCDGVTYSSPCVASCHGIDVYKRGECH